MASWVITQPSCTELLQSRSDPSCYEHVRLLRARVVEHNGSGRAPSCLGHEEECVDTLDAIPNPRVPSHLTR